MYEEHRLSKQIIERFRARPEWEANHRDMLFGKVRIGYYDTKEKDDYYSLKFDNIELTMMNNESYSIAFQGGRRFCNFSLINWLNNLDMLTKPKPMKVVIEGVEYRPITN